MKYDTLLKSIFYDSIPVLLKLLGLPPVAEYLTVEFPTRHKTQPNLVILLTDGRILHIDLQSENDPRMRWRCLAYYQAIRELWPVARITQVVIYVGSGPMTMISVV